MRLCPIRDILSPAFGTVPGLQCKDPSDPRFRPFQPCSRRVFGSLSPYPRLCSCFQASKQTRSPPSLHLRLIPPLPGALPHGRLLGKAHKRISPLDCLHSTLLMSSEPLRYTLSEKNNTSAVSGCRYNLSGPNLRSFATSRLMQRWCVYDRRINSFETFCRRFNSVWDASGW